MSTNADARRDWRLAVLAVTLGALMPGLATTILAVANGDVAADLGAGLSDLQWITSAYLLGLTGSLVLAGKLGDRFGRRVVFLIGIAGFGLTSLAIGLAHPIPAIVGLRLAQGIFGGFLTTNALSLLRVSVPADQLPTAIGVVNSVQGLSIAAGPIIGGAIVQSSGWRWTMFLNVPIAAACLLLGIMLLSEVRVSARPPFDVRGTALLVVALSALVYALIDAPHAGWGAPSTIGLLSAALCAAVAFVTVERRAADPVMPLSLFRDHAFAAGSVLSVLAFFALNGGLFLISLFWLQVQHVPATTVGVRLLPLGIAMLVGAIMSGQVIQRIGDRWALVIGSVLVAGGLVSASFAQLVGGYLPVAVGLGLIGLGLGLLVTATVNVTVGMAPVALAGATAGVQQTAGRLGATLGVAVLGGVMAAITSGRFTDLLSTSGLPSALTGLLGGLGASAVAGGVAPVPEGATPELAAMITDFTGRAFLHGMSLTMLVAAVIALVGAAAAFRVQPRAREQRVEPALAGSSVVE